MTQASDLSLSLKRIPQIQSETIPVIGVPTRQLCYSIPTPPHPLHRFASSTSWASAFPVPENSGCTSCSLWSSKGQSQCSDTTMTFESSSIRAFRKGTLGSTSRVPQPVLTPQVHKTARCPWSSFSIILTLYAKLGEFLTQVYTATPNTSKQTQERAPHLRQPPYSSHTKAGTSWLWLNPNTLFLEPTASFLQTLLLKLTAPLQPLYSSQLCLIGTA